MSDTNISSYSDTKLIEIIQSSELYRPELVYDVKNELNKRGINLQDVFDFKITWVIKALILILPFIVCFFLKGLDILFVVFLKV